MKAKRFFLSLVSIIFSAGFLSISTSYHKESVEAKGIELSLSGSTDTFHLLDTEFKENESFVYTADLEFINGQAGGIAFGAKENDHYYVLNMDRVLNRVKLIYFLKNSSGNYTPTEILTDYFIGNDKITNSELDMVNPQVATISNVNLKVILSREDEHAYADFYVEGIKRFGVDSVIDLNNIGSSFRYEGGYIGVNCFNASIKLKNIEYGESDYSYFSEPYRNQYHLQPFSKWSNDPNGLVYHNGYYHVFYQCNPFGLTWGDMYWGHARSRDLIHFEYLPICLFPETSALGYGESNAYMWSGCAISYEIGMSSLIDSYNWFPHGNGNGLIGFYTRQGSCQDQMIMYSDDEGLTWTKYAKIPYQITGYNDPIDWRDPKVFPVVKDNNGNVSIWGMCVSSMNLNKGWFLKSSNLINWSYAGEFPFPTPECIGVGYIKDEYGYERAYLSNKSRTYVLGEVEYNQNEGLILFRLENGAYLDQYYNIENIPFRTLDYGPDSYASQSFYINDESSEYYGKEVVLSWFSGDLNTSSCTSQNYYADLRGRWNGGFTIPVIYEIKNTFDGPTLTQTPITFNNQNLSKDEIINISDYTESLDKNVLENVYSRTFELSASIEWDGAGIYFDVNLCYDDDLYEYMQFGWDTSRGYFVSRSNLDDKGINPNSDWHETYYSHVMGESNTKTFYVLCDNGSLEVFCENFTVAFYFVTTASEISLGANFIPYNHDINSLVVNNIHSAFRADQTSKDNRYIEMKPSAFENFDHFQGHIDSRYCGYWNEKYSFLALDTFFRGENAYSSDASQKLRKWKQTTQYVYFTWGAAPSDLKDSNGVPYCYLKFYLGNNNEYIIPMYNDIHLGNPMLLRYFKIPDDIYQSLRNTYQNGFDMSVELVDNKVGIGDYGFHNFGYLHINQSLEEVSNAMYYYLNSIDENRSELDVRRIQEQYRINDSLKEIFYHTVSSVNEDFEDGSEFEHNWYFDRTYYADSEAKPRHLATAISGGECRPGDSKMPFNKTGDSFFRGWYEESKDAGFIPGDTAKYRFISHPFTLEEDAIVSIKMAGTASLHVINVETNPGDNQAADLAYIDNRAFNTDGNEIITNGFNTCTLVRHVINLSAFRGETIQLAIADVSTGGWGAAYFDELKVNVDLEETGYQIDVVHQEHSNGNTYKQVYLDRYINTYDINNDINGIKYVNSSWAINDNSAAKEAYDFLSSYYSLIRSNNGQRNTCEDSFRGSDDVKNLISAYNALSNKAKRIVSYSDDYQRDIYGAWETSNVNLLNVGESIRALALYNNMNVTVYSVTNTNSFSIFGDQSTLTFVLVSVALVSMLSVLIILTKRNIRKR